MAKNKQLKIHYWYLVIALLVVIVLLWFFVEYIFETKELDISKIGQSYAKPLNDSFNENAIKKVKNRLVIPEEALEKIRTRKEISISDNINISTQSGIATSSSAL